MGAANIAGRTLPLAAAVVLLTAFILVEMRVLVQPEGIAASVVAGSRQTESGKALVTFLASPAAQTILKAKGFE